MTAEAQVKTPEQFKPAGWMTIESISQLRNLSNSQKQDIQNIYEASKGEMLALARKNMNPLQRVQFEVIYRLLKKKETSESEDDLFESLDRSKTPFFLNDETGKHILGVCIVERQEKRNWQPRNLREELTGPPLTNTYEISGAFLAPEIRKTFLTLPKLIRAIQQKIEGDAYRRQGESFYVYFDRPASEPLSDELKKQFHLQSGKISVPNAASSHKIGFTRYALKLEERKGVFQPVEWSDSEK